MSVLGKENWKKKFKGIGKNDIIYAWSDRDSSDNESEGDDVANIYFMENGNPFGKR